MSSYLRPIFVCSLLLSACQDPPSSLPDDVEATCDEFQRTRRPYFGDTHVHTTLSLDANLQGNRTTPDDAYRFAKGQVLPIPPYDENGEARRSLQLDRPLDFAIVSDHAEFLGTIAVCEDPSHPSYEDSGCVSLRDDPDTAFITINAATAAAQGNQVYPGLCGEDGILCKDAGLAVWQEIIDAADAHQDPTSACGFTTFVGYEWTGGPGARNLHRNVIFRNSTVPKSPISYLDMSFEEELWDGLKAECKDKPPCDVLTIPHNSNLSSGTMFPELAGSDVTDEYLQKRALMEPLVEVYQHKSDSECSEDALGGDEQCGFEKSPYNSLMGANLDIPGEAFDNDFIRNALGDGLMVDKERGINPYKYGMIASTDTHLSAPGAVSEKTFPGHGGASGASRDELPEGLVDFPDSSPGGLAVLWAEENSREALFRAMERREAYGTSGPRIILRTFGGFDLDEDLCDREDFAERGYQGGVSMGGDLTPEKGELRFAVSAVADLGTDAEPGNLLQSVEIVKGWLEGGQVKFKTITIAGDPDNGASVDRDTCETSGDGFESLCTVWTDPQFNENQAAWYYVRVIESPSCRWTAYQCNAAGVTCPTDDPLWEDCCNEDVPWQVQERAWSSPIWYTP